jgi:hypothetical protein
VELSDETSGSTTGGHRSSEDSGLSSFNIASYWPVQGAFFARLGYTIADWKRLEQDLLGLADSGDAQPGRESPYGQKYEVRGTLNGPSGKSASVLTVWIVRFESDAPEFVTAFPGETE